MPNAVVGVGLPLPPRGHARRGVLTHQLAGVGLGPGRTGGNRHRQRLGHPEVAQLHQPAQPVGRPVVERAGQGTLRAGPFAADGVGGPVLVGPTGAEREQVDPGAETLLGLEPGVAERDEPVAVDVGNGAGEAAAVAKVDVHVDGPAVALTQLGGARPELLALLGHAAQRELTQTTGRKGAAQLLGSHHGDRVPPGEHLAQQVVADLPDLERVEGHRDRVGQLVGLERCRHLETAAEERHARDAARNAWRSASETSSDGRSGSGPGRSRCGWRRGAQVARAPARAAPSKLKGRWAGPLSSPPSHSAGSRSGSPSLKLRAS